jgi:hypothetical protein
MLDFKDFVKEKKAIVPILKNSFQYHSKKYITSSEDGWYEVNIRGNDFDIVTPIYDFNNCNLIKVRGYSYNNLFIFNNFDVAKRKWRYNISATLNFNSAPTFSAIEAIVWEDKNVYYSQIDYSNYKIYELKSCFDSESPLENLKGITPELRHVFLFHVLERESLRQVLEEKRLKESVPYRLKRSFEIAGAEMLDYSVTGKRIIVDWKIKNGGQKFNSVLDSDTFKVIEAGYCMSNDDGRHNITSMIKTAELYDEDRLIHITRR